MYLHSISLGAFRHTFCAFTYITPIRDGGDFELFLCSVGWRFLMSPMRDILCVWRERGRAIRVPVGRFDGRKSCDSHFRNC